MFSSLSVTESVVFHCPETISASFSLLLQRRPHGSLDLLATQLFREDFTVRADQEDRGDTLHAKARGHIALGPVAQETLRPIELILFRVAARSGFFGVEAQADHGEARIVLEGFPCRLEVWCFGDARAATP